MKYGKMVSGTFLSRPNRFIAHVSIDGQEEIVHVKNTGRCRELLPHGAQVWCEESANPNRKTKYDLITVRKGERLINMDSQAPNTAVREWLLSGGLGPVENLKPESFHGDSRYDFSFTLEGQPCLMEVKGVTLTEAVKEGYQAFVLFVIQMADVKYLHPNDATDPAFGAALREAAENGVTVLAMDCAVTEDEMHLRLPVLVRL